MKFVLIILSVFLIGCGDIMIDEIDLAENRCKVNKGLEKIRLTMLEITIVCKNGAVFRD